MHILVLAHNPCKRKYRRRTTFGIFTHYFETVFCVFLFALDLNLVGGVYFASPPIVAGLKGL